MASRSLKPQLNTIRSWVRQGRTDAWIGHQLDVEPAAITRFKIEHGLSVEDVSSDAPATPAVEEFDLRAEDDAMVAVEIEKTLAERETARQAAAQVAADGVAADPDGEAEDGRTARRRRGRRGGRTRTRKAGGFEATFDHGSEGYGLWLDAAVVENPTYAEYWAGHRPIRVQIEADRIVVTRIESAVTQDDQDQPEPTG